MVLVNLRRRSEVPNVERVQIVILGGEEHHRRQRRAPGERVGLHLMDGRTGSANSDLLYRPQGKKATTDLHANPPLGLASPDIIQTHCPIRADGCKDARLTLVKPHACDRLLARPKCERRDRSALAFVPDLNAVGGRRKRRIIPVMGDGVEGVLAGVREERFDIGAPDSLAVHGHERCTRLNRLVGLVVERPR